VKIRFGNEGFSWGGDLVVRYQALFGLDNATNYQKISEFVVRRFGPQIVSRMIAAVIAGRTVRIGSLEFDRKGVSSSGIFGTRKRANWAQLPEVRSARRAPWYSYTSTSGIIEISYQHPPTGQMIVIGRTSSAEENGCLIPLLIEAVGSQLAG
jgi:hypothetical protein